MAETDEFAEYRPVYVVRIFLKSGLLEYATREVEVIDDDGGFGEGAEGAGPFGEGDENP